MGKTKSEFERLKEALAAEEDEGDSSEYSEEDEDGELLTPALDEKINRTLAAVRAGKTKDAVLVQSSDDEDDDDDDDAKKGSGAVHGSRSVKSVMARQMLDDGVDEGTSDDDSDNEGRALPVSSRQEQMKIKKAFLSSVREAEKGSNDDDDDDEDDDDDDDDDLFSVKPKSAEEIAKDERDVEENKKSIAAYFGTDDSKLSKDDAFLKKFISEQWWKEKNLDKLPSFQEITGQEPFEHPEISEVTTTTTTTTTVSS
jgi:protein KRI1